MSHKVQTVVQLTRELIELLDRRAAREGVSRSALIRTIIDQHLRADHEAHISEQIVDGYRRIPPATPDEWGQLEALTDRGRADLLERLDTEENTAGFGPW